MKLLNNIAELIAVLILIPLILIFKLLVVVVVFAFLASPFILVGWLIWLVAS